MRVITAKQDWERALAALQAGGFANHDIWNANRPAGAADFVGRTALGIEPASQKFVVYTDDGRPIHDWNPSAQEMASEDWQIVELARNPGPPVKEPADGAAESESAA